jgi:hypothetical protein
MMKVNRVHVIHLLKVVIASIYLSQLILPFIGPVWAQMPVSRLGQAPISYKEGGIGLDESQAMFNEAPQWTLMLIFSELQIDSQANRKSRPIAVWVADVQVRITNERGEEFLNQTIEGPLVLINLPTGEYLIEAQYQSLSKKSWLSVVAGRHQKVWMHWSLQHPD